MPFNLRLNDNKIYKRNVNDYCFNKQGIIKKTHLINIILKINVP